MAMTRDLDVAKPAGRPLTGRAVLLMLLGFFGVIVAVNAVMATFAVGTMPGTVTDNGYRASQRFNAELEAARVRAAQGWASDAHVERAAGGAAALRLALRTIDGQPVGELDLSALLVRPTEPAADRIFTLTAEGEGRYAGLAEAVVPGAFDLVIVARRAGTLVYRSRNRIQLP
ncbi:MAG: FixH family protein [Rhizobiales bacterium]|nr:FixH family protein [Hyphomicrobiales bacterium]